MKPSKLLILSFIVLLAGCKNEQLSKLEKKLNPQAKPVKEEPLYPKVENIELAKIILKPEVKKLNITRDPFKPIIVVKGDNNGGAAPATVAPPTDTIGDVKFLGVVKMGEEFHALVQSNHKQGIFKKNDSINSYKIETIEMDHIVLKKGDNAVTIKRGEKK